MQRSSSAGTRTTGLGTKLRVERTLAAGALSTRPRGECASPVRRARSGEDGHDGLMDRTSWPWVMRCGAARSALPPRTSVSAPRAGGHGRGADARPSPSRRRQWDDRDRSTTRYTCLLSASRTIWQVVTGRKSPASMLSFAPISWCEAGALPANLSRPRPSSGAR